VRREGSGEMDIARLLEANLGLNAPDAGSRLNRARGNGRTGLETAYIARRTPRAAL